MAALGSAAAWPMMARSQQTPTMPVVGFIDTRSAGAYEPFVQGLSELGFVDHRNVIIDHRSTSNVDQMPAIAIELVQNQVAVLCGPANAILAAKLQTATIPMVFIGATDPVAVGLVSSFNRPGGNITGVRLNAGDLPSKQIQVLHGLVPAASKVGLLINPLFPTSEPEAAAASVAAHMVGMDAMVERVRAENEYDAAFASFASESVGAILVIANVSFGSHRGALAELASNRGLPFFSQSKEFSAAGGLASYGPDVPDVIRQAGTYVGRILKGEKPADLPVSQPTRFELVINLKTAKALGITVPPSLLARADEVIE
jgi:putative ABC transport system substrate-binding protein